MTYMQTLGPLLPELILAIGAMVLLVSACSVLKRTKRVEPSVGAIVCWCWRAP